VRPTRKRLRSQRPSDEIGDGGLPAPDHRPELGRDDGIGIGLAEQLVKPPDVARSDIRLEVIARSVPLLGERARSFEHRSQAGHQRIVLPAENAQQELLLGAEVVVDLAERHLGALSHRPGRERREPRLTEAVAGGVEDALDGGRARFGRSVGFDDQLGRVGHLTDTITQAVKGQHPRWTLARGEGLHTWG